MIPYFSYKKREFNSRCVGTYPIEALPAAKEAMVRHDAFVSFRLADYQGSVHSQRSLKTFEIWLEQPDISKFWREFEWLYYGSENPTPEQRKNPQGPMSQSV